MSACEGGRAGILVMAEYLGRGEVPLWWQGDTEELGLVHGPSLGLSTELYADLVAWNRVFEFNADGPNWVGSAPQHEHRWRAFELAARLQTELGDSLDVWCGAGEGIHLLKPTAESSVILVAAEDPGASVTRWSRRERGLVLAAGLGLSEDVGRALVDWRARTEKAGPRFGNGETRSLGLAAAAMIQREMGLGALVAFFGGGRGDFDELGRYWSPRP